MVGNNPERSEFHLHWCPVNCTELGMAWITKQKRAVVLLGTQCITEVIAASIPAQCGNDRSTHAHSAITCCACKEAACQLNNFYNLQIINGGKKTFILYYLNMSVFWIDVNYWGVFNKCQLPVLWENKALLLQQQYRVCTHLSPEELECYWLTAMFPQLHQNTKFTSVAWVMLPNITILYFWKLKKSNKQGQADFKFL